MILKGLFGCHKTKSNTNNKMQKESNIVNLNERTDLRIQKQLANCMKDIQQLMLHQKTQLKQKSKVRVTLQLV